MPAVDVGRLTQSAASGRFCGQSGRTTLQKGNTLGRVQNSRDSRSAAARRLS
jgi:hypothetical protein